MMSESTASTDGGSLSRSARATLTALHRDERKTAFLLAFRELCNITVAAEVVGIDRGTVYNWLDADPDFKAGFEKAREVGAESLEDVAWKRAEDTSDRLLVVLLKAYKPEKFGDKIEVTRKGKIILDWPEGKEEESKKETSFSAKAKATMPDAATMGKTTELCPDCNTIHAREEYCPG